jgi:hypothetical protein
MSANITAFAAAVLIAGALVAAAGTKLRRLRSLADVVAEVVPQKLVAPATVAIPLIELVLGVAVMGPKTSQVALLATIVLLTVFTTFLALRPDAASACECFGSIAVLSRGRLPLVRNAFLALAAVAALWPDLPDARSALLGAVAAATGVAGVAVVCRRASFLRTLDGERVDLGRPDPTLLVFWTPTCAPCRQLLGDLNRWEDERIERRAQLLVVTVGSGVANRDLGLRTPMVLDNVRRMTRAFGVAGRPAALLLAGGRVVSGPVYGVPAVRRFVDEMPRGDDR